MHAKLQSTAGHVNTPKHINKVRTWGQPEPCPESEYEGFPYPPPWCDLRNRGDGEMWWFCTACEAWMTRDHVNSRKHKNKVQFAHCMPPPPPSQPPASATVQQPPGLLALPMPQSPPASSSQTTTTRMTQVAISVPTDALPVVIDFLQNMLSALQIVNIIQTEGEPDGRLNSRGGECDEQDGGHKG